jgi:hypothetical protein
LTGGFKGVRKREWSKNKILTTKKFSAVSTFSGACNGNHTIFQALSVQLIHEQIVGCVTGFIELTG